MAVADGMGKTRAAGAALERNHKTMGTPKMTKLVKTETKLREAPTIFKDEDNKLQVTVTNDDMIKNLFGMKTRAAANGVLITGLGSLGKRGDAYYGMLTNMAIEMEPKDAVEAMLVTQMTATNAAFSYALQQMVDSPQLKRVEAFDRIANKLARTFTLQVEALKKYRAKAQQIVRVERVDVREGGQAIVGDVTHQAGGPE
jgi:energy-converting hydrogenase Eha subunit H